MSFVLADAWVVTMDERRRVLDRGAVLVSGDRIAGVGDTADLLRDNPDAERIDCSGSIIIPGMVNTHTHLFQTLLKGLGDDMVLKKWFTCMTGPAAASLTQEDVYAGALHGCVESIRSGVTTLVDFMYVHPRPGLTEAVFDAFEETGLRGFVCRGFMTAGADLGVPEALIEEIGSALADVTALARSRHQPDGRVRLGVAPCMIWTLDEESLRLTRELATREGLLLTTHVAETVFEVEHAQGRYGRSDTEFLGDIGFLGADVLAVHCVNCDGGDIEVLRRHDVKVSHNPCSNLYLASGIPPIPEMLSAGLTVGLGADGPASSNNHNLFQAMKFAALIQKGAHRDAEIMTAEKVLEMATIDGARAVGLEAEIGSIEVGKKADLVVVGATDPWMTPLHNPVSALVYSALGHEARTVVIDGRIVMRDQVVSTVDADAVRRRAQTAADDLAGRSGIAHLKTRPWPSAGF
ncbi:chlorohydrolase [Skermanella stibiiresistens SB22]|uniref:Chlorohydrolase n=1 Tax=Skermanella stibiiresistens SB22 TaxID=1385369 RepID=W9GWY4_9PROT|nr:amidohydrolase [Skermanella stibiiresistens]EWY38425.1 chlorohydrolase [Skermanella stibiiresistens SB22]